MNKTVNINLASIFFHIDEDAYIKLQRYLEAIKKSFTDPQGRNEIIADIEARIAELFNEQITHDKQVISIKEVDQVITIMGQPEDYMVDDEIFEDTTKSRSKNTKKLYRDTQNSYVAGVSSGLGHYLGIDTIWVRLLWVLLTVGSTGFFIVIYILLWILVPEAVTTTDKLTMTGKPINIDSIQQSVKKGFNTVTDSVSDAIKDVDFEKHGNKLKSGSQSFFDTLGTIMMLLLKIFAKFIGVILIFVGAIVLIALTIGLFSTSFVDVINIPGTNVNEIYQYTGAPLWLSTLLLLFAVGIPFFFLMYLGLKILVSNLKSIGNIAKFSLLGLWLIAIIGLSVVGVKKGLSFNEKATVVKAEILNGITSNDTLTITMRDNELNERGFRRRFNFESFYNENDEKQYASQGIRLIVKSTKGDVAKLKVEKTARSNTYKKAKERARHIEYFYTLQNNRLSLDNYFTIPEKTLPKKEAIKLTLYLPEGLTLYANKNTYYYHRNEDYYGDILDNGYEEKYLKILDDKTSCEDCKEETSNTKKVLTIDDKGIEINTDSTNVEINKSGIKANNVDVKVNIDEDGIEITTKKD